MKTIVLSSYIYHKHSHKPNRIQTHQIQATEGEVDRGKNPLNHLYLG
jgi:hypothetical protein